MNINITQANAPFFPPLDMNVIPPPQPPPPCNNQDLANVPNIIQAPQGSAGTAFGHHCGGENDQTSIISCISINSQNYIIQSMYRTPMEIVSTD